MSDLPSAESSLSGGPDLPRVPAPGFCGCAGPRYCAWVLAELWRAGVGFALAALPSCCGVISVVVEHRLRCQAPAAVGHRFIHSMWDLPNAGIEPVSLALQG